MARERREVVTCMERIVDALREGNKPMSAAQLAKAIGASQNNVQLMLARLKIMKFARIAGWARLDEFHVGPLYALGDGEDAPKPKAKTKAELSRKYREQSRAKKEAQLERILEAERKRKADAALSQPRARHPQDVALFGEYERRAA